MIAGMPGPARSATEIPENSQTIYPEPLAARVAGRSKRRLGNAFGLTQYGVNLTTLAPGAQSALRHSHSHEDELIYVLEGTLVLITDQGEQTLQPGMVAGFPGGSTDAHHLVNRSSAPARYLEIGSRIAADEPHYPDDDLRWLREGDRRVPAHKDGQRY
jgi:uncharacterized cupin superfamily protein